jgi:hypothetical protein
MCQSDIGIFTMRPYEGLEGPWPDFSTYHTCRNFDEILEWGISHAVTWDNAA